MAAQFQDCLVARAAISGGLLCLIAGCGGQPSAVSPPSFNPAEVASAAVAQYDKDGNGSLEKAEWQASAALAGSIKIYDTSGDEVLSQSEVATGLARWQQGEMGARPLPFQVKIGGRPLEGAEVKLIPEEFFGGAIKPASGTSGPGGRGYLGLAEADLPKNAPKLPLTQPGLYRVEITHPTTKVPAKYNTESTLGIEVADDRIDPRGVVWEL